MPTALSIIWGIGKRQLLSRECALSLRSNGNLLKKCKLSEGKLKYRKPATETRLS